MPIISKNFSIDEKQTQSLPFLPVPQNKELFYYATSAGHETWKDSYFFERQDINIYMINYVVSGSYTLTVDGREIKVGQGDLVFLHLVTHHILSKAEDMTETVYFHVLGGQTKEIYNAYLENGGFVIRNVPAEFIKESFAKFSSVSESDDAFYERSRIIYGLLTEILRLRNIEKQNKYPKFIDKILCDILYKCPPPSSKEIAEQFGFSPIYMERLFKKYVGQSMQSYILKQKYAFACRFLTDTDMSVYEIAQKVGYGDSKGLIVLFSKFGKLTPLAYRKKTREQQQKTYLQN